MKRMMSLLMTGMIILTMSLSAVAVEPSKSEAEIQPRGLACSYCGGPTTTTRKDDTGWVTYDTYACGRLGCLHALQERTIKYYYKCQECGRVTTTTDTETRDAGHFTGNDEI